MNISRTFVKGFLASFILVLIANAVFIATKEYNLWMFFITLAFAIVFLFLVLRKNPQGLKIGAYLIPAILLLAVFYVNFLPFGYNKEYTMSVDENGTVHSSSKNVWLEDAKGNKLTTLQDIYNYGYINVVAKPKVVLRNAIVKAEIEGDNVYFAEPNISMNPKDWDYWWNFTKGIPKPLKGKAKYDPNKSCVYFNGSNNETLYYPNSEDMFENDSFVVYAEWMPENSNGTNQQIIGHYNWDIFQSGNTLSFSVGRLENKSGARITINYPINGNFFNKTHEAIAIYKADKENGMGYFELYVDGEFAGRKTINNQTIWEDYNSNKDLTFGKSKHGSSEYFMGCIYSGGFNYEEIEYAKRTEINTKDRRTGIPIVGEGNLSSIKLNLVQKPKWTMTTYVGP